MKGTVVFRGELYGVFDTPTKVKIIARISIGRQFMALGGVGLCKRTCLGTTFSASIAFDPTLSPRLQKNTGLDIWPGGRWDGRGD